MTTPAGFTVPFRFQNVTGTIPLSQLDTDLEYASGKFPSVKDQQYGATGDGTTDDTAAFQAAFDIGGAIYVPAGNFSVSTINVTRSVFLFGAGWGVSTIRKRFATGDLFNITASSVKIHDLQIVSGSASPQSAGAFIHCNTASSVVTVDNVYMIGFFIGVQIDGISDFYFNRVRMIAGVPITGSGFVINSGIAININNTFCDNSAGLEPKVGIQINNCGDVSMTNCGWQHCITGMRVEPGNGQVASSINCFNVAFDNSSSRGMLMGPSGTGVIHRCRFDGCWFSSSVALEGAALISVGGQIDGITFIDPECLFNGSHGINISGSGLVSNVKILGGKIGGNGGDGIIVQTGVNKVQIIGAVCGPIDGASGNTANGIRLLSGTNDDIIITGCLVTGNTSASIILGSTGVRRVIRGNDGFVTENQGSGTIVSGSTTAVISHNLSVTPPLGGIKITFGTNTTNDPGNVWVDTIGSSSFTVNVRANPGASNAAFGWEASALNL